MAMLNRILLPVTLALLAWGFWISPDFKEIAAGVAIFLYGMRALEEGFKSFTGGMLENLLRHSTDRLWKSLGFGILSTTVMQSSSLVSVITISFLSAGLIGLQQGIGIVFGANLGTTTGAWLVAGLGLDVDIAAYAMPMLVFGVVLLFQSPKVLKGAGYVLAGMGFLFLGIHFMKVGFESFKAAIDLTQYAVTGLPGLLLYTLVGMVATVVMQSSHATLVLTITALAAAQISYDNALALAIGANVGTTITAILGAIGANIDGRRLAAAHLVFNVTTGLIAIALMQPFVWAVDTLSAWLGIAADNHTLKLAVFHSLFNLTGLLVMLPFMGPLVAWLNRTFTATEQRTDGVRPLYINAAVGQFPQAALNALRQEVQHLYNQAMPIMLKTLCVAPTELAAHPTGPLALPPPLSVAAFDVDAAYNERVKLLYSDIVAFIVRPPAAQDDPHDTERFYALRDASRATVEAVKATKHLQKNLLRYLASPNPHIRAEYNAIRCRLATLLRDLNALMDNPDHTALLALDGIRADLFADDALAGDAIQRLIRGGHITPEMATSLMNDSSYAHDVAHHLVAMAKVVFAPTEPVLREVQQSLVLDEPGLRH